MRNSMGRPLWVHIAKNGRCTVRELNAAFPQFSFIRETIHEMHRRGHLCRFPLSTKRDGNERWSYGVTSACSLPRGLTVAEVLQAIGGN